MTLDLWPDDLLSQPDIKAPITILKEQASLLGKKTKNLIEAEVRPDQEVETPTTLERIIGQTRPRLLLNEGEFRYDFYLVAKTLGYRYKLLSMQHNINLYPVAVLPDEDIMAEITGDQEVRQLRAETEQQLIELMQQVFTAKKTRRVIQALLAQMMS